MRETVHFSYIVSPVTPTRERVSPVRELGFPKIGILSTRQETTPKWEERREEMGATLHWEPLLKQTCYILIMGFETACKKH